MNPSTLSELFSYLPPVMVMIVISFLTGHLIYSGIGYRGKDYKRLTCFFLKLMMGLMIWITLYAFFKTGGMTCFLASIAAAVFYLCFSKGKRRYRPDVRKDIEWKILGLFLLFTSAVFVGILFGWMYNVKTHRLYSIFDYHFYAQISSFLGMYGIEGIRFDFLEPNSVGRFPYHYGMLWLNTLGAGWFGLNHSIALILFATTFFFSISALAFGSLIQVIFPMKKYLPLLGILIWFIGPWGFLQFPVYSIFKPTIGQTLSADPKTTFVFIFLILSFLFYKRRDYVSMIAVWILAPVYYLPTIPVFYASATLTILFLWYRKSINRAEALWSILTMFLVSCFIVVFYFTQKGGLQTSMFNKTSNGHLLSLTHIRGAVGAVLRLWLLLLTTMSPFLILGLTLYKKLKDLLINSIPIVLFVILFLLFSSALFGIYFNVLDAEQYFSKSFIPLAIICMATLLIYATQSGQKWVTGLSLVMIAVALLYSKPFAYNYQNRAEVESNDQLAKRFLLNSNDDIRMAYLNSDCFFKFPDKYNSRLFVPFNYFDYYLDPFISASLDVPDLSDTCVKEFNNPYSLDNLHFRTFSEFLRKQKTNAGFISLNTIREEFIKKYKINVLAWDERIQLPAELSGIIDSTTILYDLIPIHYGTNYYIARLKN